MVGLLPPLLWRSNFWAGVELVQLLEKLCEHAVEIGYSLLNLIYGCLWERESRSVNDGPLVFTMVTHRDGEFAHHLEVGT